MSNVGTGRISNVKPHVPYSDIERAGSNIDIDNGAGRPKEFKRYVLVYTTTEGDLNGIVMCATFTDFDAIMKALDQQKQDPNYKHIKPLVLYGGVTEYNGKFYEQPCPTVNPLNETTNQAERTV